MAAYAAGNVSPAERLAVRQYLKEHPDRLQAVLIGMDDDYEIRPARAASRVVAKKAVERGISAWTSVAACSAGEPRACAGTMPGKANGPEEKVDWIRRVFGSAVKRSAKKRVPAAARFDDTSYSCGAPSFERDDMDRVNEARGMFRDDGLPDGALASVAEDLGGFGNAGGMSRTGDAGGTGGRDDADPTRRLERRLDELLDSMDWTQTRRRTLPMTAMAAEDQQNNLCAIRCEGVALRHFGFEVDDEALIEESRAEGWLRAEGTALHHIGKLSGRRGLNVARRYDCSTDDILRALEKNQIVIAVVDGGELVGDPEWESMEDAIIGEIPDHAVVVTALDNDTITLLDPFTSQDVDTYPLPQFLDAWADSSRNLVLISDGDDYEPHPIDLSGVGIPDDLQDLCEVLAENAHEIWACDRMREGWTYGPVRDDARRQDPDLRPFNRLSDSKKSYCCEQMMNLLRLLEKLGWDPVKR